MDDRTPGKPPTFWQMLQSILAAAFGVQSGKNRARDFTYGKASHFIVMGTLFTLIFIFVLIGLVQLAMHLTAR
ncbi:MULTISPECIES: DUF2970 domain-containing protein [Pseudomonas]|jgi:hypothetical protein|uniref:DUF2970 domain-containing protein n=1 Tax=Pseudomonas xantholysinigenes TaxID=2745490 RepID=A0A9E6PU26_9PSED|nr:MULTISPECIES: DUF2970 domain-containing protein [Pseudomonas]MDH0303689.1 DUF2970 domain-containing protein [Pseudomonas sp. GD04091]MDH1986693.1 DUF2970 domain-containing protein [Pseudomonas sp. GD03689]QXI36738.1 DUF2970 domain-containing protein [Pseudomonas xantholysinigenes]